MAQLPSKRIKDLTGQRFGKLTVLSYVDGSSGNHKSAVWLTRCDCGNTKEIKSYSLTKGSTQSCGCIRKWDLTGRKYGRLTVKEHIGSVNRNGRNHRQWLAVCDCGKEKIVITNAITKGHTKSCGCLHREMASIAAKAELEPYGYLYNTLLHGAKQRGYKVELTFGDFKSFIGQDCHYCGTKLLWTDRRYRGMKGTQSHKLDRKDNSSGYTLENCVACCGDCSQTKMERTTYELMLVFGQIIKAAGGWEAIKAGNQNLGALSAFLNVPANLGIPVFDYNDRSTHPAVPTPR